MRVDAADAFVFVIPEYNHGINAPLKNALDFLYQEWAHKPAGIVAYGGIAAGSRAAEMLRLVLLGLRVTPLFEGVYIPFVAQAFDDDGPFQASESLERAATAMLDELVRYAAALRVLREPAPGRRAREAAPGSRSPWPARGGAGARRSSRRPRCRRPAGRCGVRDGGGADHGRPRRPAGRRRCAGSPSRWRRCWVEPRQARPVDAPSLAVPADPRAWVAAMSVAQKHWLVGRLETQALLGRQGARAGHVRGLVEGRRGRPADAARRARLPRLAAHDPAHAHVAPSRRRSGWPSSRARPRGCARRPPSAERVLQVSYGTRLYVP